MSNNSIDNVTNLPRFPITIFSISLLIAICTLTWLGIYNLNSIKEMQHIISVDIKAIELHGLILQLEADSAMSAQMAIATGEKKWEDRYRLTQPILDSAIQEISRTSANYAGMNADKLVLANDKINA